MPNLCSECLKKGKYVQMDLTEYPVDDYDPTEFYGHKQHVVVEYECEKCGCTKPYTNATMEAFTNYL